MHLTIANLETLCWIARLGTFSAAADRLNTTQPAISRRMRELERACCVPLFQRVGRRMELTMLARDLVKRGHPLLMGLEELVVSLGNPEAATGTIRFGVGEVVAATWFPSLIAQLKQTLPRVNFEIEMGLTGEMLDKLDKATLDVVIVASPTVDARVDATYLGSVHARWLIAAKLLAPLRRGKASTTQILAACPIWSVARPSHLYPMVIEALRKHGVAPTNVNTTDSLQMIVQLVASGAGISLLPESLVAALVKDKVLVTPAGELEPARIDFVIARRKGETQAVIQQIVALAVQVSPFERAFRPRAALGHHTGESTGVQRRAG